MKSVTGQSNNISSAFQLAMASIFIAATACLTGCASHPKAIQFSAENCSAACDGQLLRIQSPEELQSEVQMNEADLYSAPPVTLASYESVQPREMTLDECVQLALANSEVMQKLGGVIVNSPQAGTTLYDPALTETNPFGTEAALSAFDAQVNTSFVYNRGERRFNNPFIGGGAASLISNTSAFRFEVAKQTATGARFAARSLVDYNRSNAPANLFGSSYDIVNQLEVRQPLARGRGTLVNRIAGPNASTGPNLLAGQYNGVLIGRIRTDISLADFEAAVRNLVRDVETNYWELYFAYRDLDTKISARDAARETWENRQLRLENEVGRPDDEAQARQQYYNFKTQAQNALMGTLNGLPGVLGTERNLRRLMGLTGSDGTLLRPITEPTVAPVAYDWQRAQEQTLEQRVELRRQKWTLKQRELELIAAKALNRWRFDMVGQYGFRGFGDNLFGSRGRQSGSAFDDLINGDLDDWQLGVELGGAIGNRIGHVAVRNAELNLVRERAVLKEQQRQIMLDLNAAYTEVDRALANVKLAFNSRIAVEEEIEPKRKRVAEGQDQVFFLLDAEQRLATSESAIHRAITDYNLALVNFEFVSGNMLERFNVQLTEGEWTDGAQANMLRKADHFTQDGDALYDLPAISKPN
jgi:outer membrane protein TolC